MAHEGPAPGDEIDETRQRKALNRLAKWCARNAELIGEADLVQALAILEGAVENQFFQLDRDMIGATLLHGGEL